MTVSPRRLVVIAALMVAGARSGAAGQKPEPAPTSKPRVARKPAAAAGDEALARRLCDALHALPAKRKQACCGAGASLATVCTQELTAAVGRGTVVLGAAAVDRCAAAAAKQFEGCGWVTALQPELPQACRGLIDGKLKAGATCRSSLECVEGLYCRGASPTGPGVCSPPQPPRTACEIPADNLAAFTREKDDPRHPECQGRCAKGQCLPLTPAAGPCASSALCAPGLNCIAGHCESRPLPKVGESCPGKTECEAGAFCQDGKCVALKEQGESCRLPFECRGLTCDKAPGASVGTCGDPCGRLASPPPAAKGT